MGQSAWISFFIYCFVSGITPGPANLLSLATALTYGKQAALRQWKGLFTGYCVVSLLSAIAVYLAGKELSGFVLWLRWIGAGYIFWLAMHMLLDALHEQEANGSKSVSRHGFLTGFLTQLTNVKIMVFCVTALSGFILPIYGSLWVLLLAGAFLPFTGPMCNLVWLFAGAKMQHIFSKYKKPIGIGMALALMGCGISILL